MSKKPAIQSTQAAEMGARDLLHKSRKDDQCETDCKAYDDDDYMKYCEECVDSCADEDNDNCMKECLENAMSLVQKETPEAVKSASRVTQAAEQAAQLLLRTSTGDCKTDCKEYDDDDCMKYCEECVDSCADEDNDNCMKECLENAMSLVQKETPEAVKP